MSAPVEAKVTATTATALITAFIVGWIGKAVFHGGDVPDWAVGAIGGAVTAAVTFLAGWLTRHTARPSDTTSTTS